ncbi:ABC transporter ATP-binding protein [Sinomonas susongensis]|uniref:ABC transporter ATP-binding protein n=1 Tax=Sinomonas susongensis TaxID=1324851 RepID=UPI001108BF4D|nr:ABC transporter ATP-binding protein [Sinomonas susongensis]
MSWLITATGLTKEYRKGIAPAVADVSLAIGPGEVIAVVGHNGAGKSTLFDLLGGLSRPTRGSVELNVARQDIGWCPQREIVDWSLTVRQNIALGVELRKPGRRRTAGAVEEIAASLGLESLLARTAETLSGGELRRTQIGRAMAGDPRLMILDEPTTGLDPEGMSKVFGHLAARRADGASAIISTHETSRFSKHCTRVIALAEGQVLADLPVEEFLLSGKARTDDLWEAYMHIRQESP